MAVTTHPLIFTLHVNALSAPLRRHGAAEWMEKKTLVNAVYKTHFRPKDTETESKGVEEDISCL